VIAIGGLRIHSYGPPQLTVECSSWFASAPISQLSTVSADRDAVMSHGSHTKGWFDGSAGSLLLPMPWRHEGQVADTGGSGGVVGAVGGLRSAKARS
jgi:hypothetical protein